MTKIKLCGLSRPEDIAAANELWPDYVGFVFANSRRRVTPAVAAELRRLLLPGIEVVGVFVNEYPAHIAELVRDGVIDLIQLHGDEDADYITALRHLCTAPVIKAVRVEDRLPDIPRGAEYVLFDTYTPASRGGTGQCFDWNLIRDYADRPFFLSGGIGPDNVAEAVGLLHPHGVDASSALETDGKKDPAKMRAFTEAVRRLTP